MEETISQEQLDRCHRVYDFQKGEWFYKVDSETSDEEYEVRYSKGFSCTCKSGQSGFKNCKKHKYCKHVRWAIRDAKVTRMEEKEQELLEAAKRREAYCIAFGIYADL